MTDRVLLTGAGGFLGSHILETLLKQTDWDIMCTDSFRHNGVTDRVSHLLPHPRVQVLTHDLTAPFSAARQQQLGSLDYIISVASLCQVDQSIAGPAEFIRNNVEIALNVMELARVLRPRHVVHMSTDEVYGPGRFISHSTHEPSSPYAASKAAQADIISAYHRTYSIPATIVSSSNMFGERQSILAFVPRVMRSLLTGKALALHMSGTEQGKRYYTYAPNVARYIVRELSCATQPFAGKSHVLLPGQSLQGNRDLALEVARRAGFELSYILVPGTSVRPGYDEAYAPLPGAWHPEISFDDGLDRAVAWFLANPESIL